MWAELSGVMSAGLKVVQLVVMSAGMSAGLKVVT
jgi:hypothetical protein